MKTIKSHTDLSQSRILAEFLPVESADMQWIIDDLGDPFPFHVDDVNENEEPCWSLAALMNLLGDNAGLAKEYGLWYCYDNRKSHCTKHYETQIDAAFEMVCWLKRK